MEFRQSLDIPEWYLFNRSLPNHNKLEQLESLRSEDTPLSPDKEATNLKKLWKI